MSIPAEYEVALEKLGEDRDLGQAMRLGQFSPHHTERGELEAAKYVHAFMPPHTSSAKGGN